MRRFVHKGVMNILEFLDNLSIGFFTAFICGKKLDEKNSLISGSDLSSVKVTGTVKKHGRYKKIRVVKFKRRKGYMRTQGHRQDFTEVKIESIK